jgi:hypothetical protein
MLASTEVVEFADFNLSHEDPMTDDRMALMAALRDGPTMEISCATWGRPFSRFSWRPTWRG